MKSRFKLAIFAIIIALSNNCITSKTDHFTKDLPQPELPLQFSWANVNGINYLSYVRNQLAPRLCDSGWAFSVTSSLNDRIKIKRQNAGPDFILSPQVLISCNDDSNGCRGGSPQTAYEYILRNNITDETCSPYTGRDFRDGYQCSSLTVCMECWPKVGCKARDDAYIYSIESWDQVKGEEQMKQEIFNHGPISCVINSTVEFRNYTSGILNPPDSPTQITHSLSIVGWGEDEKQTKYWIARNSLGIFWGENGFIRIVRGKNALNIESDCSYGRIKDTWSQQIRNNTSFIKTNSSFISNGQYEHKVYEIINSKSEKDIIQQAKDELKQIFQDSYQKYQPLVESISSSFSDNIELDESTLPSNFTWGNVNGVNYLTQIKNQHNPQYCGGCWSFAVTSSLQDRIKILRNRTDIPDVILSNQMVINCHLGGSCSTGGVSLITYYFLSQIGVVEDSCMPYQAKDQWLPVCNASQQCISCELPSAPISNTTDISSICPAQTKYPYKKWKVSKFGHIAGVKQMKSEIFSRGPISCTIDATDNLENNYQGGIYSEKLKVPIPNHYVSVVGWGQTLEGEDYWIVRNSWGTYWGEQGFFKLKMHEDNLGLEYGCSWGVIDLQQ
ncbi:hypothetical protein ABPG72_007008 [Tetrahymena utriculariae]